MTKIINLDELYKPNSVVIIVNGERHELKAATVETFIENIRAIENLGVNATPDQEIEAMIDIILRSFPTLTDKQIRQWRLEQLRAMVDFARGSNDEIVSTDEEEMTEAKNTGNDQKVN